MRRKIPASTRGAIASATIAASMTAVLAIAAPAAFGRSGLSHDTWSEARVRTLPSGIRGGVEHVAASCGRPLSAGSAFDRYLQDGTGDRFVALHFHDLRCDHQSVCNSSGCLHQVYALKGGDYRLVWSGYVGDIELKQVGAAAVLDVTCAEGSACSRLLRWNGARFAP
jgi:hypothetical protein